VTDQDALDWWSPLFLRLTTDDRLAERCAKVHAENETLRRRLAGIPAPAVPADSDRDNLLRSLAHAVRSNDLTRARALAEQEQTR